MNKRMVSLWVGFVIVVLFLRLVDGFSAPVASAQSGDSLPSMPQGGFTVYLPAVLRSGGGGLSGGTTGSVWLPYTLNDGSILPTYGASVAVDGQGGIHVIYAIYTGTDEQGNKPATYAYCFSNCGEKTSWSFTHLGDAVQDARIALDPSGRPRIILYGPIDDPTWPRMRYQYAVCDAGCTNANSWSITTIATPIEPTATREYDNNRYFAIDKFGHPAFVYTDTIQNNHPGTFYVSCQVNCTEASQWVETVLSEETLFDNVSLAFTPAGNPRLAFGFFDANSDLHLSFYQCDSSCIDGQNWSGTTLVQIHGTTKYSLAVDSMGRPRMGVYTGSYAYDPFQSQKLLYLWCNTDCSAAQNWSFNDTGMTFGSGDGVTLVLDGLNRPRMSFETAGQGLGYTWCNTSCETDSAIWGSQVVESQADLANDFEVLPIHRCTVSTWFNGQRSSLALDPAGNPRIAYDAQHWWYGTEDVGGVPKPCNYQDVTVTRISLFNQP